MNKSVVYILTFLFLFSCNSKQNSNDLLKFCRLERKISGINSIYYDLKFNVLSFYGCIGKEYTSCNSPSHETKRIFKLMQMWEIAAFNYNSMVKQIDIKKFDYFENKNLLINKDSLRKFQKQCIEISKIYKPRKVKLNQVPGTEGIDKINIYNMGKKYTEYYYFKNPNIKKYYSYKTNAEKDFIIIEKEFKKKFSYLIKFNNLMSVK